jgi:hypothetical protein
MTTTEFAVPADVQASIQRRARVKHRMQPCGEGTCATRRGWPLPNRGEDE